MFRFFVLALAIACASAPAASADASTGDDSADCRIGAYRFEDGRVVEVGPARGGLRWRTPEGETGLLAPGEGPLRSTVGSTGRPDGHLLTFGPCGSGELLMDGAPARRIAFDVVESRFESGGETLFGRLVLPRGAGPVPVVVQVHGSERTAATNYNPRQRMLPAFGVGVFVYDKRGTGRSSGRYSQNFHLLAADAATAAREARRLAGSRISALAYEGGSQGGWVVPLAARIEPAERVIVGFGLTVSPLAENRSEVLQALAAKGYSPDALQAAGDVADATGEVMASGFRRGFGRLADLRRRHGREPWFAALEGEFTGEIVRRPVWLLRLVGPVVNRFRDPGTPWTYDPLPTLRALEAPVLWVLAGADMEAPPEQTRADLKALQTAGRPITLLEFPNTDHNIVEFETRADGTRVTTRVADGYFRAVLDFARDGRLADVPYGAALRSDPPPVAINRPAS